MSNNDTPQISVDDALTSRRSVRAFTDQPVPEATVRHILEVAARAPSGTNIQPWHVTVVSGAALTRVSDAVLKRRDEGPADPVFPYYPVKWFEPYLGRRRKVGFDLYGLLGIEKGDKERMWAQFGRNYRFFDAPVGLFFSMHKDMERGSLLDMGMFLMAVMAAARGQGLHSCPQAAWIEYPDATSTAIDLPEDHLLLCGLCLGHEDTSAIENTLVTEREPVDNFARFLST